MAFEFKLPDIGEGTTEGEIVRWLVEEGATIEEDQPLVEVMTDKATVEITSPCAGTLLQRNAKEGETVKVGTVLLVIGKPGEAVPAPAGAAAGAEAASGAGAASAVAAPRAAAAQRAAAAPRAAAAQGPKAPSPAAPPDEGDLLFEDKSLPRIDLDAAGAPVTPARAPAPPPPAGLPAGSGNGKSTTGPGPTVAPVVVAGRVLAAPATRKLAREKGIDLKTLAGSGPGGRITREDVERAARGDAAARAPAGSPGFAGAAAAAGPEPAGPREERVPIRGLRKRIAEKMAQSKRTAAHFTYVDEVDVTELVRLRESLKPAAEERGVKLTYLPFILKAVVLALRRHPMLNATLDDDAGEIVLKRYYNVAIATHTDQGLSVPVVKDVDRKGLFQLAGEVRELADKARAGKLALEDLQDSTFTITSAGSIGGLLATPVINVPEVAILGVHKIVRRPVVRDDQVAIADVMYLSISLDHRVVDGAVGAFFMNEVVRLLQNPSVLLAELLG